VPIGVNATLEKEHIHVKAMVGLPDASQILEESLTCKREEYAHVGEVLAKRMVERGACALLKEAETMAMTVIFND